MSDTKPTLIRVLAKDKTNDRTSDMKKLSKIVEANEFFF